MYKYIKERELWVFKVKCPQYGICEQATFMNAKAVIQIKIGGVAWGCQIVGSCLETPFPLC